MEKEEANKIIFWDEGDPLSVINLVSDRLKRQLLYLSQSDKSHLLLLAESDLYKALDRLNQRPNATDNRLRINFWFEYDRCHAEGKGPMVTTHITARVCSRELFYHSYIKDMGRLSWMLCPPATYTNRMQEALNFGVDSLREILELPPEKFNSKVKFAVTAKLKIIDGLKNLLDGTKRKSGYQSPEAKALYQKENEEFIRIATSNKEGEEPLVDPQKPRMSEEEALIALTALEAKNKDRPII